MSESENQTAYARVYVQNSKHRYSRTSFLKVRPTNATPIRVFATEAMGWGNTDFYVGMWEKQWVEEPAVSYHHTENPFNPDVIANADAQIVRQNETTLVIRIDDDATANAAVENTIAHSTASAPDGYLELSIDTTTGHLRRAVKTVTTKSGDTVTYEYRFSRYGRTTVERPKGVPRFSLKAIFYDVLY